MYKPDYDFKVDLPKGEEGERTVAFLLNMTGDTIEAKRDFKVSDSGNVAIEYECRGRPSGIAKTKAIWWAILLNGDKYNGDVIVFIKTGRLKEIARKYRRLGKDVLGGDDGKARMILVPVKELMSPCD